MQQYEIETVKVGQLQPSWQLRPRCCPAGGELIEVLYPPEQLSYKLSNHIGASSAELARCIYMVADRPERGGVG
jgi:hypothetical protein